MHILRHRLSLAVVLLTSAALLLLTSCNRDTGSYRRPIYTDYTVPGQVVVTFANHKTKLPDQRLSIDHIRHRIYNRTPLPYGTVVDSVRIGMVLSNQLTATLLNVTTGTRVEYTSDTATLDFRGGLMKLTITGDEDTPPVTYDLRLRTYGYDPNKLTWTNLSTGLPLETEEVREIDLSPDESCLLTLRGDEASLLRIDSFEPLALHRVDDARLPRGLRPYSAYTSPDGLAWALDREGGLYCSRDLRSWTAIDLGGKVTPTQILSAKIGGELLFVAEEADGHSICSYRLDGAELRRLGSVEEGFPIRDSYVYKYAISGTPHMLLFGGHARLSRPVRSGFFSSDLVSWGAIPSSAIYPEEGGLYVATPDGKTLFLVGGLYADGRQTTISRSEDNGVTWTLMEAEKRPGADFLPLSHAGGCYRVTPSGEGLFIFGGRVGKEGRPSSQIWRGMIDRSAGIINDF